FMPRRGARSLRLHLTTGSRQGQLSFLRCTIIGIVWATGMEESTSNLTSVAPILPANWTLGRRVPHNKRSGEAPMPDKTEPVTIKKYANRRLYNTGTSTYVTLEDLAEMVRREEEFVVRDAKTGEDITHSV